MRFYDSHAHLSDPTLLAQIDGIVSRAEEHDVCHMLNICIDPATLHSGLSLHEKYPQILNAGATTPHDATGVTDPAFSLFAKCAREKKLAAIGETGLEYFHPGMDKEAQALFLRRYLQLALETHLPVIFHCRDAFADLFSITDADYQKRAPAILHCFTGTAQEAEGVLKRGWHLSLSGIITYKKSESLRDIAKMVPLDQLLIETDAPWLSPQQKRSKQNEPSYIIETAQCIADAKKISLKEVADATFANALKLFNPTHRTA